ncbi:hypothetical protein BIV25_37320 [Streptomyces sp. MUSC 14]|uniref:hypothetical protein n=1 Tax=Streptomyces sp. MUSC 14 TaxID=1354889 RepID=UPI0008F58C89|nr:hypothetical protein [Streptomyces sp. MUSC 14]OIJ88165.1 hypothetical protein BIV25_37320 [Streptomyces sp. MUSC 14]
MDLTTAQPKDRTAAGVTPSPTEPLKHQLLATLAQHRMLSTHQLHVLPRPGRSRQSVSQQRSSRVPVGWHIPALPSRDSEPEECTWCSCSRAGTGISARR